MNKSYLLTVFLIALSLQLFAQQKVVKIPALDTLEKRTEAHLFNYEYTEAIEGAIQLVKKAEKINNNYYSYFGHKFLGGAYNNINDTIRAKKHYEDALELAKTLDNDTILLGATNNLGNIYSEDIRTTQQGIDLYNKAIDIANKMNLKEELFTPTLNIAWTYIDTKQFDKAWPYLNKSWELLVQGEDEPLSRAQLNILTGRYFIGKNNPAKARPYFEETIELIDEHNFILEASHVYEEYAKLLFQAGDYKKAYESLEKFHNYSSEIFKSESIRQIEAANIKFDVSQYQKDLEIAKQEQLYKDEVIEKSNEKMMVMIISSIGLLIILVALFRINRSRRSLISELSGKNKELRDAKEEAERLSVLKTKFFSTISHELRTPLYGVIGLTSLLLEDKSLKKHENDLKSLKFSADYLLALINDVLQINKMESNLLKLEHLPFNIGDLMRSIVKSFEFTRLQNKNQVHLSIDADVSKNLMGDPVRLSQILMNLVGNAMKFTERGNIWISANLVEQVGDSQRIYFEIKDDGFGIPENKQQIIFEEFSQLKSANYNYQGTGLGLPIVKKLLNLFGSDVQLESVEGEGSTFSFVITFETATGISEEDEIALQKEEDLAMPDSEGKTILIVDDNRINQVITRRILEQKSFNCEICSDGAEAIKKVRAQEFDLVLMDVNMPGISGLEATQQIRKFNKTVPIVALTAVEIEEIREEIHDAGMNDFIVKPYDTSIFYQVIYRNLPKEIVSQ